MIEDGVIDCDLFLVKFKKHTCYYLAVDLLDLTEQLKKEEDPDDSTYEVCEIRILKTGIRYTDTIEYEIRSFYVASS